MRVFTVTYKSRLQLTHLLPISYWHEFLDIVFFYKAVNKLVFVDSEALPVTVVVLTSHRAAVLLLIFLSEVELLLINVHFS